MGFRDHFKRQEQGGGSMVHNEADRETAIDFMGEALDRIEADDGRQKLRLTMQLDFVGTGDALEKIKGHMDQLRKLTEVTTHSIAEGITHLSENDAIGVAHVEFRSDDLSDEEMRQFREHLEEQAEGGSDE